MEVDHHQDCEQVGVLEQKLEHSLIIIVDAAKMILDEIGVPRDDQGRSHSVLQDRGQLASERDC